jgi:hypothetical protein
MNKEIGNVGKEELLLEEEAQTFSIEELTSGSREVYFPGVNEPKTFINFTQVYENAYESVYTDAENATPTSATEAFGPGYFQRKFAEIDARAADDNAYTRGSFAREAWDRAQKDLEALRSYDTPQATSTMEEPTTPTKEFVGGVLKHPFFLSVSAIAIKATVTALGGDHGIGVFLAGTFGSYSSWYGSKLTKKESDSSEDKEASAGNIDDFNE